MTNRFSSGYRLMMLPSRLVALTAAAALGGCARPAPPAPKVAPPDVLVAVPVSRMVTDIEDFTGRTEAYKYLEIRSRVSGELMKIHFRDGQHVAVGAPLFDIDDRIYKAQRDAAKAQLAQARAQQKRASILVEIAHAAWIKGAVGQEEYQTKQADLEGATAAVSGAEAALILAEQNLDWTKITAPYSGRLSRRLVDPGNLVGAMSATTSTSTTGATTGSTTGTMLTTLVVLDPIYIGFDIDEMTLERRREGIREGKIPSAADTTLKVQVGLGHQEGYPFTATYTFSENQLDPGTGTLHVRAEMENPTLKLSALPAVTGWAVYADTERKGLRMLSPGMFVRVRLPMGQPHEALMIPEEAIGSDQGQKFVYVVNENNEAVYRRVVLGPQAGEARAIEQGIAPGERVIVSGQQRVRQGGGKVNPKMTDRAPSAAPEKGK
ncbi:MAG: efflux transporter periplasmic adaptor subunit [Gemmataceae bacterium]|nr:efflux transporter periplasmic adaptor subunit [Gemmataceae bacterium]